MVSFIIFCSEKQEILLETSLDQYEELIDELKKNKGSTTFKFREKLSRIAFSETAYYDSVISNYFTLQMKVAFLFFAYFVKFQYII